MASTLARATVWRETARPMTTAAAAWPWPCSLDAGYAGFYAGARHGVARDGACDEDGGGCLAVTAYLLGVNCAGFYAGARHGLARGGACDDEGGGCLAVTVLARRGLRWLLRWRAPRCGARRRV